MAAHNSSPSTEPVEQQAHVQTYSSFISMVKMGTIVSAVIAAIVVLLIAN